MKTYIVYLANDIYELPCAFFDTVAETALYCRCCRDEVYDSIKFGDVIHGYKIDFVDDIFPVNVP